MCSTIATPPPRRIVWAGRAPSLSSSMLRESMPTSAAPAVITMEGRVDVRPGVREQVDLADLKGRARRVAGTRGVTRQPVADRRCGKTAVGHHPVLDLVTQVDQAGHMRANALSS